MEEEVKQPQNPTSGSEQTSTPTTPDGESHSDFFTLVQVTVDKLYEARSKHKLATHNKIISKLHLHMPKEIVRLVPSKDIVNFIVDVSTMTVDALEKVRMMATESSFLPT
jgi:hypothetical protein